MTKARAKKQNPIIGVVPSSKVRPVEQKESGMCGPAALRTLLRFFKIQRSERSLARICKSTRRWGTDPKNVVTGLRKMGFIVHFGTGGSKIGCWKKMNYWINTRGLPVLVDWFSKTGNSIDGHYSVMYKIDRKHIWLADPEFHSIKDRLRKIEWDNFFRVWFDFEGDYIRRRGDVYTRWWLVAYPAPPLKTKRPR